MAYIWAGSIPATGFYTLAPMGNRGERRSMPFMIERSTGKPVEVQYDDVLKVLSILLTIICMGSKRLLYMKSTIRLFCMKSTWVLYGSYKTQPSALGTAEEPSPHGGISFMRKLQGRGCHRLSSAPFLNSSTKSLLLKFQFVKYLFFFEEEDSFVQNAESSIYRHLRSVTPKGETPTGKPLSGKLCAICTKGRSP